MLNITKSPEPDFFKKFKKKNKPKNWAECSPITTKLRKHILETEQQHLAEAFFCTYCERKVTMQNSHIEHVKPKCESGEYSHLFADYNNLTISCKSNNTCSNKKDNDYSKDFINPIEENPSKFMTYNVMTGDITATKAIHKDRVKATCNTLGLNSYELTKARRTVLIGLKKMRKYMALDDVIANFKKFPTLLNFYRQEFIS